MLITLAIIGVVAALTIPTVVAKYQKQQYYTQFMKTYNTLSDAISLAVVENGDVSTWNWANVNNADEFMAPILSNLKIEKKCSTDNDYADCGISDNLTASYLNYYDSEYPDDTGIGPYIDVFTPEEILLLLDDGSFITYNSQSNDYGRYFTFQIDTNGIKGPNVWGRDMFFLHYIVVDNKYKLSNMSIYKKINANSGIGGSYAHYDYESQPFKEALDGAIDDCSTTESTGGTSCAGRLILEGKMDY